MNVSFIIPVFNHLDLTLQCVQSLQETVAGIGYEILLVNDGSDDATRDGLHALAANNIRILNNDRNRGYAHSNNHGALHARGEFLFLLNNDLILQPGWLEPMLAGFKRVKRLGIIGNVQLDALSGAVDHSGVSISAQTEIHHVKKRPNGGPFSSDYKAVPLITGACCAIRRKLYIRMGGFDEAFLNGGEDFDLCLRLKAAGFKVAVSNKSIVKHHVSATRRDATQNDERNSRLLFRRWNTSLASLAASRWPDQYLLEAWRSRNYWSCLDSSHLSAAAARFLTLKKGPAPVAINHALCGLERKERHWKSTLDGWTDEMIRTHERQKNATPLKDKYDYDGLHLDSERADGVWIRETASVTLPKGTLLTSISIDGYLYEANAALPEEAGHPGLAISVNGSPARIFHPINVGSFSLLIKDPAVRAGDPVCIQLRMLGTNKSNVFAYLGRILANVSIMPRRVRQHFARYRPQRLNKRLSIQSVQVNGEDVFNFKTNGSNPLNTEYAIKHAQLGINLVGWFKAELGIGESVRLAAKSIKATDIPYSLIPLKVNCLASQGDTSLVDELTHDNRHPVNVFHIDAPQSPDIDHHHGKSFRDGKYNIAYWAWELPDFPDSWSKYFRYFDEIWTPSNFVRDSISMKCPLPVITVPHCIDFSLPERDYRAELGLPADKFLFTFAYDLNSYQERKNPRAVIEAFKLAFSGSDRAADVGLVIKIHSTKQNEQSHRELLEALKGVENFYLIDKTLSREMTYGLMQACDSYVSLHRAEGFGLTVAESMFLGKPVISTNWSATSEFLNATNGCPVKFNLEQLTRNFGPYQKGQVWADADPEHAADYMRRLVDDSDWSRNLGKNARQTIVDLFSPQRVGDIYRRRLRAIALW